MSRPTVQALQRKPSFRFALIAYIMLVTILVACSSGETEPQALTQHDGVAQQVPEMPTEKDTAVRTDDPSAVAVKPAETAAPAADTPPTQEPDNAPAQAVVAPKADAKSAPAAPAPDASDPRAKHGETPTLRASTHLLGKGKTKYPLVKPDWSKPYAMTFRKLMANYQYYQVHGEFFEKGLPRIHGGAIEISGAIMPIDAPGEDGKLSRFWLANPLVVMAGCVFCNPPTLGDLIYVEAKPPLEVDREALYQSVVTTKLLGRLFIDGGRTADGVEYLYHMQLKRVLE